MLKNFTEEQGRFNLVGTFIHHQAGTWDVADMFDFRFNEEPAQGALVPTATLHFMLVVSANVRA
jgi:hypothetical protein